MRIAFLSYCKPIDLFVLGRLTTRVRPVGVLQVVDDGAPRPATTSRRPLLARVARVIQARWYEEYYRRMDAQVGRTLFHGGLAMVPVTPTVVARSALHAPETVALMRHWAPDMLVVSGAPILRPELYGVAPIAVNVHLGLAPDYRGEHTLFWPLLRGDYDRIGATLHRIDRGVDTGRVLVRVYPELAADDDETTLVIKSLRLITTALLEFIDDAQRGRADQNSGGFPAVSAGTHPTPPGGHNIRYGDRGVIHDLAFAARRAMGQRPPPRPERVERLY